MATTESQELGTKMDESISGKRQAETSRSGGKKGGWITFPFLIGTRMGLTLAEGGHMSNFIVYLIQEFHGKSIRATHIANVVIGCGGPIIGAIIADSFVGCFSVISISSCITLLGTILVGKAFLTSRDATRKSIRRLSSCCCCFCKYKEGQAFIKK